MNSDLPLSRVKTSKVRMKQVHFNIPEDLWRQFRAKLPSLGYSTSSEFLREKIREAVSVSIREKFVGRN